MTETAGRPAPAQLPYERRAQVVELLRRRGVVRANDLAAELDVSVITIRRDIALLASRGVVRRVRGGAVLSGGAPAGDGERERHAVPEATGTAVRQVTVGVVVPSLTYYWPDVIRGVREAATPSSARVVLRGATYQAEDERRQLSWLVESMEVDGLLVAPTTTGEEGEALVRWLQAADLPVVLLERAAAVGPYREAMESVVSDHALGAAMAVRHLATLGHRRVGVLTAAQSPTTQHVRRGWRQACEELGLALEGTPDVSPAGHGEATRAAVLDGVLDACLASGTTAMLVHSDPEAMSLVERCQVRGVRVPGDLSLVAYDDEVAELCDPPLTAVRPPKAAVGRAAFELLAARLADRDAQRPAHRVVIAPRLMVRSSSSAPR
ncbi:substrate-binding domain-containing protein [Sphaerisporangium dianthi]|uniref:Substrate-binding domain-containing protein n=1 Tax=Sphaerisporangium dianthi TaxID=1436120 RepID=A0ABV9CDJ3_9ACTN